jgi:hypothetical protein
VTWVLLAAALAVAVVVAVALPFLREPAPASDALHELDPAERRLLAKRISDEDYRAVVGSLRRDAAEALRTLDRLAGRQQGAGTSDAEAKID